MKKIFTLLITLLLICIFSGPVWAGRYRAELHAGDASVFAGMDVKDYLSAGYYRVGGDIVYSDDDDEEYRLADGRFTVGSETIAPGLQCELGLKMLFGTVENRRQDGDVGAIGFMGRAAYLLPQQMLPIPVRFSANFSGAPSPLALMDLDSYSEFTLDAGFFIVENAAMVIGYRSYHFKMDNANDWKTSDDSFTIGIELNF